MSTVRVYDLMQRRVLVTRESAHTIRGALISGATHEDGEIVLDFSGVEAITPSFIDEVLAIIDDVARQAFHSALHVKFVNAPTKLSEKFAAVGRNHRARITESGPGDWIITRESSIAGG